MNRRISNHIYTLVIEKSRNSYILWLVSNGWEQWDDLQTLVVCSGAALGDFVAKMGLQMLKGPVMIGLVGGAN
jgi:hypothetical protein